MHPHGTAQSGLAAPLDAESARREEPTGAHVALARNRAFAAAGRHEGAAILPSLRLLVVTCLDPRVDPAHVLGLHLGDAMVIRNGGGRVTPAVIDDVAFVCRLVESAVPEGPPFEVAVIHHTQCRANAFAPSTLAADVERLRDADGISARVSVSGHVYDVDTGQVRTVIPAAAPRSG
jgi:carbonic anhydrase